MGKIGAGCLSAVLILSILSILQFEPIEEEADYSLIDDQLNKFTGDDNSSNSELNLDAWLTLELISWQGNTSTTWDTDGTDMDVQFQICIDLDGESDGVSPLCTWTEVWNNTLNLSNAWETTFDLIEDNNTLNISIECWDNDDESDEWNNGPDACDMNPDDDEWRLYYEVNWSTTTTDTFSGDGSLGNDTQWGNAESVWKVTVSYYGDEDNDGISDNLDKCQGTFRDFRFDLDGCSWYQLDDDFDGTINDFDPCPSLAHESYCGTSGDYLQVFNIDFRQTNKDRLYGFENWDISPNGEHLAIALGMTFHAGSNCRGEESVSGLIVISLDDVADGHNFCDATGVQFNPYHYNSVYEPNPTSLKFSKTGHALYYKEDTSNFFAYNTSNWVEINEPHQSQTFSFTTNEGQTISRGSGGGFLISDINGEQISIQTRNQHPGVISIDGTDDSKSVLVASKDEEFSGKIYDNAINSTLSIYDLTTGQKKDVQLPSSLQENGEAYFLGVKISANGLRIIVHHASNYGEWFAVYERDRDADGLVDTEDLCPDENGEFSGCLEEFFDTDDDGVNDKDDQCPGTMAGVSVDFNGCALNQLDSDGDGISDANDQCPNTASGDSVGLTGCSASQRDTDEDGLVDSVDACPNTPTGEAVDAAGCGPSERDTDGDGVVDSQDECPSTPNSSTVDLSGCSSSEVDSDADGLSDAVDDCPRTPQGEAIDSSGCALSGDDEVDLDEDQDGVFDSEDECDETPRGVVVDEEGCALASVNSENQDDAYDGFWNSDFMTFCTPVLLLVFLIVTFYQHKEDENFEGNVVQTNQYAQKRTKNIDVNTSPLQYVPPSNQNTVLKSEMESKMLALEQDFQTREQHSSSQLLALQQELIEMRAMMLQSDEERRAALDQIQAMQSQTDNDITLQDSVVAGDALVGSTKIEQQVVHNDPEAIIRAFKELKAMFDEDKN